MRYAEPILRALCEPILLLDKDLRAVMANPAFCSLFQISPEQLRGKTIQELVSATDETFQWVKALEYVAAHVCEADNVEVSFALPDCRQIVLSLSARPVTMEQDAMILVELRDVTQERNAERIIQELNQTLAMHVASLERTNRELESFSHSVSHDLRTPLRLMNKIAHGLLEDHGADFPDDAIDALNIMIDSTREMEELIEALLTFSRVISNPIKKRRVDLKRLAREAMDELHDEQTGRTVEFVVEELPPRHVDRVLFKHVFLNLFANALKFTRPREKAEIRIGYTEIAGEPAYFVRDNGVGFDMDKADSLFVAFRRLHASSEFEGSGIGLALVRRIVERHGGHVWCESELDKGATFYFTLSE